VLSIKGATVSGVTNASLVTVGEGRGVTSTAAMKGLSAVGVTDGITTGEDTGVPNGVGVRYCPHRDALPTQDAVSKETVINKAEMRFTIRPL
jgi:hypothetical protein